jgi:nucleotide-binding universal stress UspA family protein
VATYQTVIVGIGTGMTRRSLLQVSVLAAEAGAELILVAAREYRPSTGGHDPETSRIRDEVDRKLAKAAQICVDCGARDVIVYQKRGDPVSALVSAVREHRADLLVVGSGRIAGGAGRALGAVSGGVAREASCDVMIARIAAEPRWDPRDDGVPPARNRRSLVVGVHGTPRSVRAAERAASIAAARGSRLVVVGADDAARDSAGGRSAPSGVGAALDDCSAMARARGVPDVVEVVVPGDALTGLVAVANEYEADLLVVGNNPQESPIADSVRSICVDMPRGIAAHVLLVH